MEAVFKGSFIGIEYSLIRESGINELTFDQEQPGDIFYGNGHFFVQDIHVTPSPGPMARLFSLKPKKINRLPDETSSSAGRLSFRKKNCL